MLGLRHLIKSKPSAPIEHTQFIRWLRSSPTVPINHPDTMIGTSKPSGRTARDSGNSSRKEGSTWSSPRTMRETLVKRSASDSASSSRCPDAGADGVVAIAGAWAPLPVAPLSEGNPDWRGCGPWAWIFVRPVFKRVDFQQEQSSCVWTGLGYMRHR
jgi:hypothetical protein